MVVNNIVALNLLISRSKAERYVDFLYLAIIVGVFRVEIGALDARILKQRIRHILTTAGRLDSKAF